MAYLPSPEGRRIRGAGGELLGRRVLHCDSILGPLLLLLFVPHQTTLGSLWPVLEHEQLQVRWKIWLILSYLHGLIFKNSVIDTFLRALPILE